MYVRVLTLAYSEGLQGFPEEALRQATFGREVLEVREHFFVHGGRPHLALVLLMGEEGAGRRAGPAQQGEDIERRLPESDRALYRSLRQWRNERARREGIPSYLILRNQQLAEVCRKRPKSLAELKEIEGVGEATAAKYGAELLGLLGRQETAAAPAAGQSASAGAAP